MANDKTLFGVSLGPHTPFETTIVGGSVGFAMGFVREWRRNKLMTTGLRRTSSIKAGGTLGASFGLFIALYTGTSILVRDLRDAVEEDEYDIPASVLGGSVAGLTFGLRRGPRAGCVGMMQGAVLGFSFGAFQELTSTTIRQLRAAESDDSVCGDEAEREPLNHNDARDLVKYMESVSKRMEEVSKPPVK